MAKGQYLSGYQQGIVKRFYEHRDSVLVQRLQEAVSDLALDPASEKLWKKAAETLRKLRLEPPLPASAIEASVGQRSVEKLAELVASIDRR